MANQFKAAALRAAAAAIIGALTLAGLSPSVAGPASTYVYADPHPPRDRFTDSSSPMLHRAVRWQQVYDDSFFGAKPLKITSFAFRAASSNSITYGSDFKVSMSTTTREPGSLSATFAENIGADESTVLEGPITVTNVGGAWTEIDLATPFQFNPSAGNLLLEITHGAPIAGNIYLSMFSYEPRHPKLQRVSAVAPVSGGGGPFTVGLIPGFGELVTRFVAEVPEPSSSGMALTALVCGITGRRRQKSLQAAG